MNCIKVCIKGYIKNENENTTINFNAFGIKNENKINYVEKDVVNKIVIEKEKIILIRENKEFKNTIVFKLNEETISEYLLKENNFVIELKIYTIQMDISNNLLLINYLVVDSDNQYEFYMEMSEKI